ncbi:MAG: DUF1501 domain-containing protein [Chthoniobacterales bacterium]|nr:DUF1501 domain-containing protein [Chthoniobacterales bacterium]
MNKTLHTRRQFLRTSLLGGAVAWSVPVFLERTFFTLDALAADSMAPTGKDEPILVILQLAGGNDGLNTLVPFADDAYHRTRPGIAIKNPLKLNEAVGLHPRLTGLRQLYDDGHLGIVQGVGYPNPNRSHFRSTEIWQTASDAQKAEAHGWIGRYFDACCKGADPSVGVSIGAQTPQAFAAAEPKGISFSNPEQFRFASEKTSDPAAAEEFYRNTTEQASDANAGASIGMLQGPGGGTGDTMDFLRRTALDAQMSSDKVLEITRKSKASVSYPPGNLANSLNLVARLIGGGLPTRVYYVGHGGYDTHTNQAGSHDRLMGELDAALAAFTSDLKSQGNFHRVALMTFSEFGRRVAENGSGGTDHGAAAPLFVMGGAVKPGLYGTAPSLTNLHDGDLVHNVDFRSVYATVLKNWLKVPVEPILHRAFPTIGFI